MPSRPQPCLLIVEDDRRLREDIAEHLTQEGFAVAQAPAGSEALDRLKASAYDGLVIDLKLPDAGGLDVLDAALARYPEMVAVVISVSSTRTSRGMRCAYSVKPAVIHAGILCPTATMRNFIGDAAYERAPPAARRLGTGAALLHSSSRL